MKILIHNCFGPCWSEKENVEVELSNNVTEYTIIDYDGLEYIIYIKNGHLYKAYYDDDINDIIHERIGKNI